MYYEVVFFYYGYNTGNANNGDKTGTVKFHTLEEAMVAVKEINENTGNFNINSPEWNRVEACREKYFGGNGFFNKTEKPYIVKVTREIIQY